MRASNWPVAVFALTAVAFSARAEVIGTMAPAEPLTAERIEALPVDQRASWRAYLARSQALMRADKDSLASERKGLDAVPPDPRMGSLSSMPLNREDSWYATREARAVADSIMSFQTPAGGWSKNMDRTAPPRLRGQAFALGHDPRVAGPPGTQEPAWAYVGTIDNGATWTEMRFLARVQAQLPGTEGNGYRAAFARGLTYLLDAQYPNGGWPQVYPLQGGYHDAITFNDGAIGDVVSLLSDVAERKPDYQFISGSLAERTRAAVANAIDMTLAAQVVVDGKRTIWAQQYDMLTLAPAGARNFEPAALASFESVDVVRFLDASVPRAATAVADARAWFESHALRDVAWKRTGDDGPFLRVEPGAGPIWARYYAVDKQMPIFGDRDKSVNDDPNELSRERRIGYSWFNNRPCSLKGMGDFCPK